jgi:hypothetical protein
MPLPPPRTSYDCSFCTASIDVLTGDVADLIDWLIIFSGSSEPTIFCPRCAAAYQTVIAAFTAGIDQALARRTA